MSTISTMGTGHRRLADGSLLRVDIELGRWVGSLYTPDMRVNTQIIGSDVEVHAWAERATQRNYGEATYWHNHPDLPCLAQSVREQMELQRMAVCENLER